MSKILFQSFAISTAFNVIFDLITGRLGSPTLAWEGGLITGLCIFGLLHNKAVETTGAN